jgi:hypothetical protein
MPLSETAFKWACDRAGLGSVPGLNYEKIISAFREVLGENDITQFFGKISEAIRKWERENGPGRKFPAEYAVIRIHPYAARCLYQYWPAQYISFHPGAPGHPTDVFGAPILEDARMFRTSWELQLGGKLLESGEVLEWTN